LAEKWAVAALLPACPQSKLNFVKCFALAQSWQKSLLEKPLNI
jgi:hypothetical protein